MNKILSISIAIIVLIIAVEGGYLWRIKTSPQSKLLNEQVISKNNISENVIQPTQPPQMDINTKNIISRKTLELANILKEDTKKVTSGELKTVVQDLIKAGALRSEIDRLNYKSSLGNYYIALLPVPELTDFPNDDKFRTEFTAELKQVNLNSFSSLVDTKNNDLAKLFYRLGLIAYQNNRQELVLPLWTTMVNLSPEWSHFQLELANYYLASGNIQEAKNSIYYCDQFSFPDEICDSFLQNEIQNNQPQTVGFMKDRIQTEVINN